MLNYSLKNGRGEIWTKTYTEYDDYTIRLDFDNEKIAGRFEKLLADFIAKR